MRPHTIGTMLATILLTGCCLSGRCLTGLQGDDEFQAYVQRIDAIRTSSGDAKEVNRVTQTDQPWPPYVGNPRISVDGRRMTNAIRNYSSGPVAVDVQQPTGDAPEWPTQPPPPPSPAAGQ